jgi:hypothetical protein
MSLLQDARRTILRWLALVTLLAIGKASWFVTYRAHAEEGLRGQDSDELILRRAHLVQQVTAPDFGPHSFPEFIGDPFRSEWALVSLSMSALALGGLIQRFPSESASSESDLEKIIDRALTSDISAFDTARWSESALDSLDSPHGHIGYLGHLALILAVDEFSFPNGHHRDLLARLAAAIARKIDQGPCGLAETYPNEIYLPDNAVALAALSLAERAGLGPKQGPNAQKMVEKIHIFHSDKDTGLWPFRIGPYCKPTSELRASGASWSLLYLALIDEPRALRGYEALRKSFVDQPIPGLLGVREWRRGTEGSGDVNSGPLLLGLSPAATGFTVALAHRAGDGATLQGLLDTAELAGFTVSWKGRRSYGVAPVVGDAILLAARAPLRPAAPR